MKSEMIGIRIPTDLLEKIDRMKEEAGADRTTVILNALKYWVKTGGNVTSDAEYLTTIKMIATDLQSIMRNETEIEKLHNIIAEQQNTINSLLRLIPRNE